METEAATAHRALEEVWSRLYGAVDGARFERRGDLMFALYPPFPIPQCNGPWVVEDTSAAAAGLAGGGRGGRGGGRVAMGADPVRARSHAARRG